MIVVIVQGIFGGIIASLVWFVAGGALYMNPLVTRIYKSFEQTPGLKKWYDEKDYMIKMYVFGILIQCLLFGVVYSFIKSALSGTLFLDTLSFGLILMAIKIIPRLFDMWLQSTYHKELLLIELVNGSIESFIISFMLVLLI